MKGEFLDRISTFSNISVKVESIEKRRISGNIVIEDEDGPHSFKLIFTYFEDINVDENLAGLVLTMPAINFTLFSKRLTLNFPVRPQDREIISEWLKINNREVFVNRLCIRRHEFFLSEYLPDDSEITEENSTGCTEIVTPHIISRVNGTTMDQNSAAILSSGGKESLLTSGILSEIGANVHHVFINESGGHWNTAKTSFDFFTSTGRHVEKIWTNVDRFYHFSLDRLKPLNRKVSEKWADDYPVQLFIFPVYIFASIPLLIKHKVGNVVMGDEFDDPLEFSDFKGLKHYYGIYDQTSDFNLSFTKYLKSTGLDVAVWSAVYPINGSLEEKIIIKRYPELFRTQRSCHSCRNIEGRIVPCGKCSKCLGILLFIIAAGGDPMEAGYTKDSISLLEERLERTRMRLDPDELILMKKRIRGEGSGIRSHVDMIHILPEEDFEGSKIPQQFRNKILEIFGEYASGICRIDGKKWVQV